MKKYTKILLCYAMIYTNIIDYDFIHSEIRSVSPSAVDVNLTSSEENEVISWGNRNRYRFIDRSMDQSINQYQSISINQSIN